MLTSVVFAAALLPTSPPMQQQSAGRRSVLAAGAAAAACSLLAPGAAHAGYALQAASQASQSWDATGKEREKQVYQSIKASIDAKRPDRPEIGELGYVGGEYTKEASRKRNDFDRMLEAEAQKASAPSGYSRPEEFLGAGARVATSPRAAMYK